MYANGKEIEKGSQQEMEKTNNRFPSKPKRNSGTICEENEEHLFEISF